MKKTYRNNGFSVFKFMLLLVIIVTVGGGWFFYQHKQSKQKNVRQFITEPVKRGKILYSINASGMVYPKKTVAVGAQVSGKISHLAVEIGDEVEVGDDIAEIDARMQENAKKTAEAQLQSQKAALSTTKSQLSKAQADFNRSDSLFKGGAGSKENHDAMYAALVSAKNAVTEAQARIRQSELTIENSEFGLGYTRVTAPIAGTVIAVPVKEGQIVNAVQSSPTLVRLAQTDVMTIKTEISEADVVEIRKGLPVTFKLLGKNSDTFHGVLSRIDPAPKEISDNGTVTSSAPIYYYGHIDVENKAKKLRHGMTAMVSIEVNKAENTLLVPMNALQTAADGKTTVSILTKGKIEERSIILGINNGIYAQVLNGLNEGDNVIINRNDDKNNSK